MARIVCPLHCGRLHAVGGAHVFEFFEFLSFISLFNLAALSLIRFTRKLADRHFDLIGPHRCPVLVRDSFFRVFLVLVVLV